MTQFNFRILSRLFGYHDPAVLTIKRWFLGLISGLWWTIYTTNRQKVMAAYFSTHSALKNANWRPKGKLQVLIILAFYERGGERERTLFWGRGTKKKKLLMHSYIKFLECTISKHLTIL